MSEEFKIWLEAYGIRYYSNPYCFYDGGTASGLTPHGDDMYEAYKAGQKDPL